MILLNDVTLDVVITIPVVQDSLWISVWEKNSADDSSVVTLNNSVNTTHFGDISENEDKNSIVPENNNENISFET
ncbi:hypothetical protein HZS_423 [Henneguya salminicola]|nr:hypothetical protein HZS_423 [Henneguya salminicola]